MEAATAIARRQYGAITWPQARACGVTRSDLRRLLRGWEWLHPHHQVYAARSLMPEAGSPERLHCLAMAAQLVLGPRACAVGRIAARLWGMRGLPRWDGRRVHMAVPALKAPRKLTGVELHGWDVRPEETTVVGDGVRVTDPGRTLRDSVPDLDRDSAVCLMDSALNQGLVQEEDIAGINDAMRGRRGCVDMRRWWRLADGRAQSPLETRIRLICQDGGLPPGELQRRFTDQDGGLPPGELQRRFTDQDGGTIAMVDFWWEKARLIGKADELGPHGTPRALVRAWERQNALQKLYPDVRIVRFTWADLRRPGYILALVAAGRDEG